MDLLEALEQTDTARGPRSNLEHLLEDLGGDLLDQVLTELRGQRQAAHLARALTLIAQKNGVIGDKATISGQSITKWRAANVQQP
jgi:hypothetical protein